MRGPRSADFRLVWHERARCQLVLDVNSESPPGGIFKDGEDVSLSFSVDGFQRAGCLVRQNDAYFPRG